MGGKLAALKIESVSRHFGGVKAVSGCDLDVLAGEITGLIGPNGAGKSTLLKILAGQLAADRGRILWEGTDITRWPVHRRGSAGLIRTFQLGGELARMTVLENLLLGIPGNPGTSTMGALFRRRSWRRFESDAIEQALVQLEKLGLESYADEYAASLSGGQKRMMELARAFLARPKVLLLDEPMAGVSPIMRERVIDSLLAMRSDGVTCIIVEHALDVMDRVCDQVAVMALGRVIAIGEMAAIRAHPKVIEAYLG